VFGDTTHWAISSKYMIAGINQVETRDYSTEADFEAREPDGTPTIAIPGNLPLGSPITVEWNADTTGARLSHKHDWVGLYERGACNDESTSTLHNMVHECWLSWQFVDAGLSSGVVTFGYDTYDKAGEFEVRYFYGDSIDGQGYRCVSLTDTDTTYRQCLLHAKATSSAVFIGAKQASTASMQQLPGLVEKYCDGSTTLCES